MNEVVFNTEADALAQEAIDFQLFMSDKTDPDYLATTTRWAEPRERIDGKWAYPCLPNQDYSAFVVEEYDIANYPEEEDVP